jgi:hypothetical protein
MAAPIPELAPVTTATLSALRCILKLYDQKHPLTDGPSMFITALTTPATGSCPHPVQSLCKTVLFFSLSIMYVFKKNVSEVGSSSVFR